MNIRAFEEEDRSKLREVYLLGRKHLFSGKSPATFELEDFDQSVGDEELWVAECDDDAVGFISIWAEDNFIHNLFVHPEYMGKGVGSALLEKGLARIGRPATLKCLVKNREAVNFYASRGWRIHAQDAGSQGEYYVFRIGAKTS